MSDKKKSSRRSLRKAQGTRHGTLINWREESQTSRKTADRYGRALRDGRQ